MTDPTTTSRRVLLNLHEHIKPGAQSFYVKHYFTLPEGTSRVGMTLTFDNDGHVFLFPSLHGPDGFRGSCMDPRTRGEVRLELWTAPDGASTGALPGELARGEWYVQVYIAGLGVEADYQLETWAEFGPVPEAAPLIWPEDHVVRAAPGWYCGELHSHSTESDGETPVGKIVETALAAGLDFLAVSDHYTTSQWRRLLNWMDHPIAHIRSCELTAQNGHANLQGLQKWVDIYTDRPGWDMNQAAAAARRQGALFCVNHPFSVGYSWQALDFDWHQADLMEVSHTTSYENNNYSLALWDRLLCSGYRVVGIAGTDSHHPTEGWSVMGKLITWVYADELSERGILAALRRGQVYISQGAQLAFSAVNQHGERAGMWQSLPSGSRVSLEVRYRSPEPLQLMVIKDGFLVQAQNLEASPKVWSTAIIAEPERLIHTDRPLPGYYRVELHAVSGLIESWQMARTFQSMRAVSNPIWVGMEPPRWRE